jgi:hypothetical protein
MGVRATPSPEKYLALADQCLARAKTATDKSEVEQLVKQEAIWRKLAEARLPNAAWKGSFPRRNARRRNTEASDGCR